MRESNDVWITKSEFETEAGETKILDYFLQNFASDNGESLYGLRVDKSSPDGVLHEREETYAVTDCRDEAFAMVEAFARGSVPPCTLLELADDWLAERESRQPA